MKLFDQTGHQTLEFSGDERVPGFLLDQTTKIVFFLFAMEAFDCTFITYLFMYRSTLVVLPSCRSSHDPCFCSLKVDPIIDPYRVFRCAAISRFDFIGKSIPDKLIRKSHFLLFSNKVSMHLKSASRRLVTVMIRSSLIVESNFAKSHNCSLRK